MSTVHEELTALRDQVPEGARNDVDAWLVAIEADRSIEDLRTESGVRLWAILGHFESDTDITDRLHECHRKIFAV
ncbi:hypothetical protein KKC44_05130 [Patescibacteria group bacterium]|nr:hypothetical protein [Patescibacteria group bacterium]